MFLLAFEDEFLKQATPSRVSQMLRNTSRRKSWLKGNARERFVSSRSGSKTSPAQKYYAKKRRELKKLEPKAPKTSKIKPPAPHTTKVANDPVKETVKIHGIPVALEWRKGETRKYYNHDPLKPKSTGSVDYNQKMKADYGYVKGVIDADGEELDVYLGPNRESEKVFVLEKLRKTDDSFDENKIMLGYDTVDEAKKSYLQHQGKDEMGKVTEMTLPAFKAKFVKGKNNFKKHGNGDMMEYFMKHPKKLKEYKERQAAKKKLKLKKTAAMLRERIREGGTPLTTQEKARFGTGAGCVRKKLRVMRKKAGACKKTFTWGGLTMKLECLKGDTRFKGAPHERVMKDHYGYMPGTYGKGEDGDAIDVYFNPEPLDGPVFKVKQLKKDTGELDEFKFMVGYGSAHAAKKAFLRNMPSWAFGSMTSVGMDKFKNLVGQNGKKSRVPSDGNAERERVRKALG